MLAKTIYLIRHGQIELPKSKRTYIGQINLPLSQEGYKQGQSLAQKLSKVKLDKVFSSDLSRSLTTAQLIAEKKGLIVEKRRDLREISLGEWEGLSFSEVASRYPQEFKERGRDIGYFRPPGGESFADCSLRVLVAFNEIIQSPYENIAIVGHAGVNRLLICHILGMPIGNLLRIVQDYACLNIIITGDFGYRIKALNR
ncbi:MAG: alpha-ribazole phosphatase [Peptococcales bacterium]|jgi:alpha-ribazole phosphatase